MNNSEETHSPPRNKRYSSHYEASQAFLIGRRLPLSYVVRAVLNLPIDFISWLLRDVPGPVGYKCRSAFYRLILKKMGKNVLIDVGVVIYGPQNITLADFVWIDAYCIINALNGEISVGRRVHIGPFTSIAARQPVTIEDYVGISGGVRIYAASEKPLRGKRMSGPMLPEQYRAFETAPILLKKDSFVGTNSVILPGVTLGEGAVVGAGAVISRDVEPYAIVIGRGRVVGKRPLVTCEDV